MRTVALVGLAVAAMVAGPADGQGPPPGYGSGIIIPQYKNEIKWEVNSPRYESPKTISCRWKVQNQPNYQTGTCVAKLYTGKGTPGPNDVPYDSRATVNLFHYFTDLPSGYYRANVEAEWLPSHSTDPVVTGETGGVVVRVP
jgi:hypothetical protein